MTTEYHAKYWAHALTASGSKGSVESITQSISNAMVDLNPHQVEAALFGLKSPISKGAILADEVGLGKTIEAGLILTQRWAERKRRILLVVPATLRKQWQQELEEKFFLPSVVLEAGSYKKLKKESRGNPFVQSDAIVICSYQFVVSKQDEVTSVPWDLAVVDEAHRLRNVYKSQNKTAAAIKESLQHVPKLLLTATPLQNSLMELYGLVSIIDEHVFGDKYSFRAQFVSKRLDEESRNLELKDRLRTICKRSLRRQVIEYVPYTNRTSITQEFVPTDDEHLLYEKVSAFLQRETLICLPNAQRKLITLVLRKLLASSTFAIGATLGRMADRLNAQKNKLERPDALELLRQEMESSDEPVVIIEEEYDSTRELQEEWGDEEPEISQTDVEEMKTNVTDELRELAASVNLANLITENTKGEALIKALKTAFEKTEKIGAKRKAVIFTESRKTQDYLFRLLTENGYGGEVVILNGTNTDAASKAIYDQWLKQKKLSGAVSGAKTVDIKAAIVEEFRDRATILVATEAAAEGVNLQFCSLVVNYDLPWNPQRIEQRIGRCHRYGQKHDVVVVNFLNKRNAADQRVYELLSEKFKLFDGVFGASDEVLGVLESGVDIEKRIAHFYQNCRTEEEIQKAFDSLQTDLDHEIQSQMYKTRQAVLDNFDEEVHSRLKLNKEAAQSLLDTRQKWLLQLTEFELGNDIQKNENDTGFSYSGVSFQSGKYYLHWQESQEKNGIFYRPECDIAQHVIQSALNRKMSDAHLSFKLSAYPLQISILKELVGQSGWIEMTVLDVQSLENEQFLILSGVTDEGQILDHEYCEKLLSVPATASPLNGQSVSENLASSLSCEIQKRMDDVRQRNTKIFDEEMTKLDRWAEDLKYGLEQELKDLDAEIREATKKARLTIMLEEKLEAQKQVKALQQKKTTKRRRLFESQDEIDARRDRLIEDIEKQLETNSKIDEIFRIRWTIVE
ncbi:MAG: DEAD/DEAH box helicase family protein [Deltaproteobacteria bacterium]|nr:DEAD/DEAH box helicase family protein [Deltaproteobacteria bacterium]MBN2673664.1 DEAD/DEAH box helicase family protein [Deltaproteobacteria bacterium]